MQIYWGAVPFVLIQILMVALIIFFPQIVSGGLDKKVKVDLKAVTMQMQADFAAQPEEETPTGANIANDDPMKAMLEAMKK
jgi:type IV secretory pathway VirB6-like protein